MNTKARLSWHPLANGDLLCREFPIRLTKPLSRSPEQPGWLVRVPSEDEEFIWTTVGDPDNAAMPFEFPTKRAALSAVPEHLTLILDWAREVADDGDLASLWTGDWTAEDQQKVIDREAAVTAQLDAAYGRTAKTSTPKAPSRPRPTSRAALLDLLDEAAGVLADRHNVDSTVTAGYEARVQALLDRISNVTR